MTKTAGYLDCGQLECGVVTADASGHVFGALKNRNSHSPVITNKTHKNLYIIRQHK